MFFLAVLRELIIAYFSSLPESTSMSESWLNEISEMLWPLLVSAPWSDPLKLKFTKDVKNVLYEVIDET